MVSLVLVLDDDSPWRCCLWNEVMPTEEVSSLSTAYIVRVYQISWAFDFKAHWKEVGGFWHLYHQGMRSLHLFCKKSFLQKSFVEELAEIWLICTCHVTVHLWPICEFGTLCFVTGLPKPANFNDLFMTQVLNPPLGRGEDAKMAWVAILNPPPPRIGEFFFFAPFSLVVWHLGYFLDSGCNSWSSTSFWS